MYALTSIGNCLEFFQQNIAGFLNQRHHQLHLPCTERGSQHVADSLPIVITCCKDAPPETGWLFPRNVVITKVRKILYQDLFKHLWVCDNNGGLPAQGNSKYLAIYSYVVKHHQVNALVLL